VIKFYSFLDLRLPLNDRVVLEEGHVSSIIDIVEFSERRRIEFETVGFLIESIAGDFFCWLTLKI
jgi:hypothetical protein